MAEQISPRQHYAALDGLRGVAILLVIIYHNFNFIPFFNYGWLGVDLFFVLSGFLITDILINTVDKPGYLKNFYIRRVLRIFPLYYLALFLFLVLLPAIPGFNLDVSYFQKNQWWFLTYLQNWLFIFKYDGKAAALVHFWSLAVEEQFYLVWPFVILLLRKPRALLFFCIIVMLSILAFRIYVYTHQENFKDYNWLFLFTRIDGLILGSMVTLIFRINRNFLDQYSTFIAIALASFNFLIYFLHQRYAFSVWAVAGFTSFSALFAILVYKAVKKEDKIVTLIFTNRVLRFLGKYSYGFYVFHFPILLMARPYADKFTKNWSVSGTATQLFISSLISTVLALIVSIISYHLFEKKFLNMKRKFVAE